MRILKVVIKLGDDKGVPEEAIEWEDEIAYIDLDKLDCAYKSALDKVPAVKLLGNTFDFNIYNYSLEEIIAFWSGKKELPPLDYSKTKTEKCILCGD
jgi:hypothetical protein